MKPTIVLTSLLCGLVLLSSSTPAKAKKPEALPELTGRGKQLEATYAGRLEDLKADVEKELPAVAEAKVAAWQAALEAEEGPAKEAAAKAKVVAKMRTAEGHLRKLEENKKYAPETLADARASVQWAKAMPDGDRDKAKALESAEKFLASRQKECDALSGEIEKAKAALAEAKANLPEAIKAAGAAKHAYEKARAAAWKAMNDLGVRGILGSDKLDGKLVQYMVIHDATPRGLAAFAQQSLENEKLVEQLLADEDLMVQMLVADGPNAEKYGEAMRIYTEIQKASPRAKDGVLQRLALATALVHATPIQVRQPEIDKDKIEYVDPVKRYLRYEKWYLNGELDQTFKDQSVWGLTMVVDASDPDEVLAWGRETLRNLRPDCVPADGDTSIYVDVVDKEIRYSSAGVKDDLPGMHFMQNILANGGICGRRAFFGRFILRAFGVPTTARKQPGHATLAHWHPDGWKTRLGGDWGPGARGRYSSMNRTRSKPYGVDLNFLASTQAREDKAGFTRVKRAQWIGDVMGEERVLGLISKTEPAFWHLLSLLEQQHVISELANKSDKQMKVASASANEPVAAGKVTVNDKGVIAIPAAACSNPTESVKSLFHGGFIDRVVFLRSTSGQTLLHMSRYSTPIDSFEYRFDAPKGGKYQLAGSVVTPSPNQGLLVSANGAEGVEIPLPYTVGMWAKTEPVEIELAQGRNLLKFGGPARATIDHFTLAPVK